MAHASEKRFPVSSKDYKLYEEVGEGVSATVYRALCVPLNEMVAIKVLDLEKCNNDLDGIRREVQTMILIDHPNLLRAHCSFTSDHSLWVVMPYMAGGSCLHIMKSAYPEGFEEQVIATLLREVLKALVYLHAHGHIHRDVKAGNILVDSNGSVKLADFGVSACMFDTGDRQRSRNTFVGTPCWMAPEVMQQLHGYDFKADIWSFGITALELAHGHAPFSKYPPMKVLLMTLQNAPPGLDYERDRRFSKSFKEMVAACLVKDPKKRPTSEKLLKHHFFKQARPYEYLARTILEGLSPLGERFRILKAKEADFLVQNKAAYGDKEHLSQQEYIRGISAWNFNLEDLKAQAAIIQDDDGISIVEDSDMNSRSKDGNDIVDFAPRVQSPERANHVESVTEQEDGLHDLPSVEGSLASSFPLRPLQALKGYFDICEDDVNATSPNWKDTIQSDSEQPFQRQQSSEAEDQGTRKNNGENMERNSSLPRNNVPGQRQKVLSGSLLQQNVLTSSRKVAGDGDRESVQQKYPSERNYSGPLPYRQKRDINNNHTSVPMNGLEDTSDGAVVQRKGRFKVTSAEVSSKGGPSTNCLGNSVCGTSNISTVMASAVLPSLQHILQQNAMQREQLIKLIKCMEQTPGAPTELADAGTSDLLQVLPVSGRERELQSQVLHLQQSIGSINEELQLLKMKNAQIERELNAVFNKQQ
ncbi:serine/threonine-protein kinase BLUS1 isoform X2 [Magnolia sinica]|uniref:serine/threonine-protein kinase BLUS1 isoform X2 n=1 Tax=Magnolia sinica TaxID=86752 RepID=UPI0026581109|nr:serine/threonine-protein kinase BLUS1 isoform X2 [Magnolia sinica]